MGSSDDSGKKRNRETARLDNPDSASNLIASKKVESDASPKVNDSSRIDQATLNSVNVVVHRGKTHSRKKSTTKPDSKMKQESAPPISSAKPPSFSAKPRHYTVSIAVPGSIVVNAQSRELKTLLVGQIARAAAIYQVDEIVVYDDKMTKEKENSWNPNDFMARILQYIETPQYLRKLLIPMHPDLKFAGLLSPLDAPHHVRADEHSPYREGIVVDRPASAPSRAGDTGSFVYIGTKREARIDRRLAAGMRVTVELDPNHIDPLRKNQRGCPVAPSAPREKCGMYWGYSTRISNSLQTAISESPFPGGYDLTVGTSERGSIAVDDSNFALKPFQHALIVFGGVQGIEASIDNDESVDIPGSEANTLFDYWVNMCPEQGSRTIRTEEAVLLSLAKLQIPLRRAARAAKQDATN